MLRHISTRFLTHNCLCRASHIKSSVRQLKYPLASNFGDVFQVRYKYVTSGIQGRRNSKVSIKKYSNDEDEDDFDETENSEDRVAIKDR